jgi:hypothetical protein
LEKSKCITDDKNISYLLSLLGNKRAITTLLFRLSDHDDFHLRCNGKGPTISLFKVKDGDCIGGYTSAKWSLDTPLVYDNMAMLFNLSKERCFPHTKQGVAMKFYDHCGPCFSGNGSIELAAYDYPFDGERKCISWANAPGYQITKKRKKNMLTNRKDGMFTITELEVWEVKFID